MKRLIYEIRHETAYAYQGAVSVSHHLLRLTPRSTAAQQLNQCDVTVDPAPAVLSQHCDYFGNATHFLAIERPHESLTISARSRVSVSLAFVPDLGETMAWEQVGAVCRGDHTRGSLEAHEFTYPSTYIPVVAEFSEYARPSFARGRPVLEAVVDLTARIHADFTFDTQATTVSTPIMEVLRGRRGVCQDFAHLQIACLRSLGLPARYVSGYLETDPPPGHPKLRGVDASHAWVSFYTPGIGWIDVDPTNNCLPSLRHVTVGWGRDYGDVCPVRGVLVGGNGQTMRVSVDMVAEEPVAPEDPTSGTEPAGVCSGGDEV
jgi:transglutaminase-like putative cysteine protease